MTRPKSPRSTAQGDYEVGYGRPPRHTQFQPGQSGNPRGRPKQLKSVSQMLRETVSRPITITENGRRKRVTWLEALFAQIGKAALQGDAKAIDRMIRLLPAIQAAFAEEEGGRTGGPGPGGELKDSSPASFDSAADRELLRFFADQIARGELSFDEPVSGLDGEAGT